MSFKTAPRGNKTARAAALVGQVAAVDKGEQVRVNIITDEATRRAWKIAGAQRNMTVTDMILEAMGDYLKKN